MNASKEFDLALKELKSTANSVATTRMSAIAKIHTLVQLNMRVERVMFDSSLKRSPYEIVTEFLKQSTAEIKGWGEISFIEDENRALPDRKSSDLEAKHHELFQDLWVNFNQAEYLERIERYVYRLKINGLADGFLAGKTCLDVGCGHGNFAHALVKCGAARGVGIDFGEKSIEYATQAAKSLKESRVEFRHGSAYSLPFHDNSFDVVLQNGVFHHLEDEDRAIKELHRVLKPGGHLWYYTDGSSGIYHRVWDTSCEILREVPHELVVEHLAYLNLSTNKRYHLGDGLNATYRHTTWEEITSRLTTLGFTDFKRLRGGFPTDLDGDVLEKDGYAKEKFGSGDLRILAKKT